MVKLWRRKFHANKLQFFEFADGEPGLATIDTDNNVHMLSEFEPDSLAHFIKEAVNWVRKHVPDDALDSAMEKAFEDEEEEESPNLENSKSLKPEDPTIECKTYFI